MFVACCLLERCYHRARMRRRELLFGSMGVCLASCGGSPEVEPPKDGVDLASELISGVAASGQLRAAVLTVQQGADARSNAFGEAASEDAVFLIASISKPMTATGLMLLADRGELKLSDPAQKFIPEFSEGDRSKITIKHLLTHTSGLPDQLPENQELREQNAPIEDFVKRAIQTPLLFEPGSQYKYQSMGILLASEVAQRITGERFPDFLDREVFRPLGMTRTAMGLGSFSLDEVQRCQVEFAAPESGAGDPSAAGWDWNSPFWRNFGAPWGGAHSTAPDVNRFLQSFLHPDGKVLKEATARSMISEQTPDMDQRRGLGFALNAGGKNSSSSTFGHGGSTGTLSWADPEADRSFVLLTSLPARESRGLVLGPVSDLASG